MADQASTQAPPKERGWRAAVAAVGVLPVGLIAISMFGVAGLRDLAIGLLFPALAATVFLTGRSTRAWGVIGRALVVGMAATALYDLFRFGLLGIGVLDGDPIPHIGTALGLKPAWVFGYLWRYVGDGGGLAVTFFVLGFRGVRAGIFFGLAVCAGLLLTLAVSPHGQELLFPLGVSTVVMATIGHVVYGGVLGALAAREARTAPPVASRSRIIPLRPRAGTGRPSAEKPVQRRSA